MVLVDIGISTNPDMLNCPTIAVLYMCPAEASSGRHQNFNITFLSIWDTGTAEGGIQIVLRRICNSMQVDLLCSRYAV